MDFASPHIGAAVTVVALVVAGLVGAIVPTCLYLYVEPRGRRQWGVQGDTPASRRAPFLVRASAWLGFAVAQTALPMLVVPVVCGGLLYAQIRLGAIRPIALAATALLGLVALAQAAYSLRLFPMGVRLLARDAGLGRALTAKARGMAILHGWIAASGLLLGWGLTTTPSLVHPIVRGTLMWTALRPIVAYAIVSLLHALLLARCARSVADVKASTQGDNAS